jgi:hypothetical protein
MATATGRGRGWADGSLGGRLWVHGFAPLAAFWGCVREAHPPRGRRPGPQILLRSFALRAARAITTSKRPLRPPPLPFFALGVSRGGKSVGQRTIAIGTIFRRGPEAPRHRLTHEMSAPLNPSPPVGTSARSLSSLRLISSLWIFPVPGFGRAPVDHPSLPMPHPFLRSRSAVPSPSPPPCPFVAGHGRQGGLLGQLVRGEARCGLVGFMVW